MISLRTENLEKYGQSAPVAFAIEQIDFSNLWDLLLESLEYVRGLEGILEIEAKLEDEFADDTSGDNSKLNISGSGLDLSGLSQNSFGKENKGPALSSLTMRFMSLIECYLTVCSCSLLAPPPTEISNNRHDEKSKKRIRDETNSEEEDATAQASSLNSLLSPIPLTRSDSVIGVALQSAVKQESLPGYRFRYLLIN
jgi:hypothetical protein